MNVKLLKKIREKEEKLLDIIEEMKMLLEDTDDEEFASLGDEFSELMLDFLYNNDALNLNEIKDAIAES